MKILTTTSTFSTKIDIPGAEVIHNPNKRRLTEQEIGEMIEKHQPVAIIAGVEPITREVLKKAENLKIISRCGVGLDSVDLAAAAEMGIRVANTPDAPTVSVAELTIALILNLLRNVNACDSRMRAGAWPTNHGFELKGKQVGLIGCGRIGTCVAGLLKAFGCRILGYDPFVAEHPVCRMVELDELLRCSDIVSLHIPFTRENKHIIGANELGLMKNSALLINVARGGLVDEDALYAALKQNTIAGAAMDCFAVEPYKGKLAELQNIILTPHMGSGTREARMQMEQQALDHVIAELRGLGMTT